MAASSTWDLHTVNNIAVQTARCSGFARIHGTNNYTFIVDLEWTDDRSQSVKRAFHDFQNFHASLVKLFPELKHISKSRLSLRTSFRDFFTNDKQYLAEQREPIIDNYLIHLFKQPERIRHSSLVLNFFEPRDSDPRPCKTSSPSEKSDSGVDLTHDKQPATDESRYQPATDESRYQPASDESRYQPASDESRYREADAGEEMLEEEQELSSHSYSDEDYTDTEEESEGDNFDQDYFLDMGFGELMLSTQAEDEEPFSPSSQPDTSMWCSNLDKFSNILRTSMTNLHNVDSKSTKQLTHLNSIDDSEELFPSVLAGDPGRDRIGDAGDCENSDTESQRSPNNVSLANSSEQVSESDELIDLKPLTKSNIQNYYLSTTDLSSLRD